MYAVEPMVALCLLLDTLIENHDIDIHLPRHSLKAATDVAFGTG